MPCNYEIKVDAQADDSFVTKKRHTLTRKRYKKIIGSVTDRRERLLYVN